MEARASGEGSEEAERRARGYNSKIKGCELLVALQRPTSLPSSGKETDGLHWVVILQRPSRGLLVLCFGHNLKWYSHACIQAKGSVLKDMLSTSQPLQISPQSQQHYPCHHQVKAESQKHSSINNGTREVAESMVNTMALTLWGYLEYFRCMRHFSLVQELYHLTTYTLITSYI